MHDAVENCRISVIDTAKARVKGNQPAKMVQITNKRIGAGPAKPAFNQNRNRFGIIDEAFGIDDAKHNVEVTFCVQMIGVPIQWPGYAHRL